MKFAIRVTETSTAIVIVDTDNYEKAVELVQNAYDNSKLDALYDGNLDFSIDDDTENYIKIVGKERFEMFEPDLKENH